MATINIIPNDTLLFRDSKPFQAGEDTWATGTFPPYPSVLYGAIRTGYFANNIDRFNELKRDNKLNDIREDETAKLKINSYSLNIKGENYFPVPLDFNYFEKENPDATLKLVGYKKYDDDLYSNYPLSHLPDISEFIWGDVEFDNVEDGLIAQGDLKSYLNGDTDNILFRQMKDCRLIEPKVGIARKFETRTADKEKGKLYRVGMFRMREGVALNVSFSDLKLDESGFLKLGGESKSVVYTLGKNESLNSPPEPENKKFKLYLSTPAVFKENGWVPDWIDPNNGYKGIIPNTKTEVELICAFTGKSKYISGFDMSKGKPKPMLKVIPAGSVYYFEIQGNNYDWGKILKALHGKSISTTGDYAKQGFGISYIGKL